MTFPPGRVVAGAMAAMIAAFPLLGATSSAQNRTTIGGYGEVHFVSPSGPAPAEANLARFVVFLGHAFSERIAFRSELEIEDARLEAGSAAGEVALEQAYIDYRLSGGVTLRTGLVLIPVGIVNETHEPPTFNGVARPGFDHDVIPTTWREIGVGATGSVGASGFLYRLYVVNGLRAEGLSADEGIRGGRQEGQQASFANPSLTGRVEWSGPGLKIGGSFWYGGTADREPSLGTGTFAAPLTLLAVDLRYDTGPFLFRGVATRIAIRDAGAIHAAYGNRVGSRIDGGYLEGAVDLLALAPYATDQRLFAFIRHERYNTQAAVPAGITADPALARRITTLGLTYKPVYNIAFKADYQLLRNRAGTGEGERFSLGAGYLF